MSPVWLARLGVLALGLVALPTWAEVDKAVMAKAEALLKAGKFEQVYQLLDPLEVDGAGDPVFDYLLATASLHTQRQSKATVIYERMLAASPDYAGVRLDMGRAYFELGDYARAKVTFETVLAVQELPKDLRTSVEQYVRLLQEREQARRWARSGYADIGLGRDSNITSANNSESLVFPAGGSYAPARRSDNYVSLGFGGELNYQLNDRWGWYGRVDYRGRSFERSCDNACFSSLGARTGLSYTGGAWSLRTGVVTGQYELNTQPYLDTNGVTWDWKKSYERGQLSLGGYSIRTSYLAQANNGQNSQTNMLSASWLMPLNNGRSAVTLTGSLGSELATQGRADGNRSIGGLRVLYQQSLTRAVGLYTTVGWTSSKYHGQNSLYLLQRDEALLDMTVGLAWTVAKGWTVRPQLGYVRNNSNADAYAYDKVDGNVSLRYDF